MTGRAAGYCRGGLGLRNRFYATARLRSESERLHSYLENVERRLAQIETT